MYQVVHTARPGVRLPQSTTARTDTRAYGGSDMTKMPLIRVSGKFSEYIDNWTGTYLALRTRRGSKSCLAILMTEDYLAPYRRPIPIQVELGAQY